VGGGGVSEERTGGAGSNIPKADPDHSKEAKNDLGDGKKGRQWQARKARSKKDMLEEDRHMAAGGKTTRREL